MSKLQKVKASSRHLDNGLEMIALFCLLISVFGAIISVFLRYVFGISLQIVEEICRYTIIYGVFAYIGPLIKRNAHLKMDLLKNLLKGKMKYLNNLVISVILFASFIFLLWSSIIWTKSLFDMQITTVAGTMLMFIPALAIPMGMFLGCLYSMLQIVIDFLSFKQSQKLEETTSIDSGLN
ncbi:TRAP transporter small permease [Salinibacillus xinjiangensis]|uniref:TRAP transporter small permease subunit n=1 Tax=Salinibacillus xinjiangensis TaxID=1229268 RepID=A0A6G1X1Q3_9BACI|nr:TRAP transporter small permease subunit [Salinibacillus xinjiangensis]MRG84872.1 TRAP transporter small permease subunit [Salinibacillus xinjiangensis]